MLVYGREPILPTEANLMEVGNSQDARKIRERALAVRNIAADNINKRQTTDKTRYDEKHRHLQFEEGEQVKVFTPVRKVDRSEKLLLRWFGPYYIIRKVGEVDYEIQKGPTKKSKKEIVHVSRILPYNDPWTPEVVPGNNSD